MGSRTITSDRGVERLLLDLGNLLEDTKTSDVTLIVGKKETQFPAHSFLLRNRCKSYSGLETRFPHVSPEIFRPFLLYVYTGKLSIEEPGVFDLLCLAGDFGMDDLQINCEEILFESLEPNSVCSLLTSALQAKAKGRKSLERLISKCTKYIGENPGDCLQRPNFLSTTTDCLISIISSDQLCLEEEEVWRLVLKWSMAKAGVETHVSRWSEEERVKVAKYLSPVISHVRLLLIDSRVFAEEVEPTGCVPIELSLERYRFAALPNQFYEQQNPRLTPRNSPRLFQSSQIINSERSLLSRKLNEWFGGCPKQVWKCIYRASTNGFSADAFHTHCDGKAPTICIALIQNTKWICGGFNDVPWNKPSTPRFESSSKAFLFSYDGNSSTCRAEPQKFSIVKKHFAICNDAKSGPIFGAGADLYIASNCNTSNDSYSNLPHSYELSDTSGDTNGENNPGWLSPPEASVLTPSYNFTVSDYEVFVPIMTNSDSLPESTTY